tara:strand:+ start:166 stop:366 length:201 start_codon:yes stop_codon:yes gene_type:complete
MLLTEARNMSQERKNEIRELLFNLDRKIKPLEWDASRNQINEFKKLTLEKLKEEHSSLLEEMGGLE